MTITSIAAAALLASYSICMSLAEDRPDHRSTVERQNAVTETSAETVDRLVTPTAKASGSTVAATGTSEVFRDIFIVSGKSVTLDSALDYSSANTVAVTVLCTICGSAATSLGSSGLVLQPLWSVPDAETYVTTENKAATAFLFWDVGGALFNVYGTRFRLTLQNKGTRPISIRQATIFRRGQ